MIFGRPGSGKSTFALKLSRQTGIPVYHLDRYFYEADWVERNYREFLDIQQNLVNKKFWIIDGNSTKSLEMRYSQAHLVLYFNYAKILCCWRVFKRLFNKDLEIHDRAEGCPENLRFKLIRYMWGFEKRVFSLITDLKAKYLHVTFIEVRSDRQLKEIENYLDHKMQWGLTSK